MHGDYYRCQSDLEARLQFEREKREALEAEMDQLRKQLQKAMAQLQHYQSVSSSFPTQQKVFKGMVVQLGRVTKTNVSLLILGQTYTRIHT